MIEKKNEANTIKEVLSWVWTIFLAFLIAAFIRTYIFELVDVPTGSMLDTIQLNDKFIVNKFIYRFEPIKRGDIVVFKYPDNPSVNYVKRVIGVGGDVIDIKDGKLYINGELKYEPYIREPMVGNFGPYKVPKDHFFVMGDNRNDSSDSRYWVHKYVSREAIIGKVVFRILPLNRIGPIK
ncbi:signal peptidase I . Serine peptidase. MEROPS family S26A [Caldanaerobius fijiensis DSM 17918]|uniref:Signal peptidase I n=2 Tax=Caldanaerobius TaxID=862261 RepID=A0A1M4Y8V7_9THEO|nr:signal peptidase I [Caldanaerobius fijiensis]SHF02080.1 signal peptidase I . Serine peptidase. MEROPS family S26A [Caldanaerobius fijiensis DSM 17918]